MEWSIWRGKFWNKNQWTISICSILWMWNTKQQQWSIVIWTVKLIEVRKMNSKWIWNIRKAVNEIMHFETYRLVQPNRIVRCLTFLGGQSVDMFAYILLVHGFLLRLKSIVYGAAVFLIIYMMKNETKEEKKINVFGLVNSCLVADCQFGSVKQKYYIFFTHFKARKRLPGNSVLVGAAQTSKGALTVQKARMLHFYQLQKLSWNSSWNDANERTTLKRFQFPIQKL